MPTFVFKLKLSDLTVFLLDPQNQTRTWTMSGNLVQCVNFFLVLTGDNQITAFFFLNCFSIQFLYNYASTYFKNNVHKTRIITQNHFTCFMASTRLLSDVVCSINISAALSWLRSLSTKDLASAKTFSKEQFIPEQIEINYY